MGFPHGPEALSGVPSAAAGAGDETVRMAVAAEPGRLPATGLHRRFPELLRLLGMERVRDRRVTRVWGQTGAAETCSLRDEEISRGRPDTPRSAPLGRAAPPGPESVGRGRCGRGPRRRRR